MLGAIACACEDDRPDEFFPADYSPYAPPYTEPPRIIDAGTDADAGPFSLEVVRPESARCGETVTLTAKLRNDDGADAPYEARILLRGSTPDVRTGIAPARSVTEIPIDLPIDRAGRSFERLYVHVGSTYLSADLSVLARGASLSLYPTQIDFGDVGATQLAAPVPIYFVNLGDEPLEVLGLDSLPPDVYVDEAFPRAAPHRDPFSGDFAKPAFGSATLRMRTGLAGSSFAGTVQPRLGNVTHCGPIPSITVKGSRAAEGAVTITPLTLVYPPRNCTYNEGSIDGEIRIGNRTTAPLAYAAFPGEVQVFKAKNRSGVIAPGKGESLVITVSHDYDSGPFHAAFDIDLRSVQASPVNTVRTAQLWFEIPDSCPTPP